MLNNTYGLDQVLTMEEQSNTIWTTFQADTLPLLVIYGKKSDLVIYSGIKLQPDTPWSWDLNLQPKWETPLVPQAMLKLLKILKLLSYKTTGTITSFKKNQVDKKMLLSLLDSMMDLLMINSSLQMTTWLPLPLKHTIHKLVSNIQSTKLIAKKEFLEFYMEDMLEILMLEEILGSYPLELWQPYSTEMPNILINWEVLIKWLNNNLMLGDKF